MKIEYKSMFLGAALGVAGVFAILFLLGDVETEFSFSTGENENKMDKNIDVRIEKTVENGQDFTNVVVKGSGDVTKEDLDKELERLFNEHGINKNDSNINIEMEINS
ncbi:MAG TPA: hypothetical protein EYO18_03100 [Candidatus Marinimicrobia bacterium]|nr:hypothetical protein [Candidatus Neomarinimicrobiota bacterium]